MEGCEIFVRLRAAWVVPLAWATDAVAETASAPSVAEHLVADRLRGYPPSDITNVRIRAPKAKARAARTHTHTATPTLGPRAADPAAPLRRALIELIDGERPLGGQEQQVAPPP